MNENSKTSLDMSTIRILVSGGYRKFVLKENVVTAGMCFYSQDRRIIFYVSESIPADHKEGVMDSVSQKNYHLSLWKQSFKHTYITKISLNIIHMHNDNYPQVYSNTHHCKCPRYYSHTHRRYSDTLTSGQLASILFTCTYILTITLKFIQTHLLHNMYLHC